MSEVLQKILGLDNDLKSLATKIDFTQKEITETKKLIQHFRLEPYDFVKTVLKRITTTSTKFDKTTPNFSFKNPLDDTTRVFGITFLPDANFKLQGDLEVDVNKASIFDPNGSAGAWTDVGSLNIAIPDNAGKKLAAQEVIDFYIMSYSGVASALTIIFTLGKYVKTL